MTDVGTPSSPPSRSSGGATAASDHTHDLVIIGTGSGNSVITDEMDHWNIALVEEGVMGGTCLNRGCIPTKMFVHTANLAHQAATSSRFGIDTQFKGADWPAIRDRIFDRIDPIATSGRDYRQSLGHVELIEGHGEFVGQNRLQVGDRVVSAPRFVLAAGAHAVVPPILGLDDVAWHTSDTIMRIDEVPNHLVIVGGGFIAVEMAHVFGSFGARVTILARGDRLLRHEDPDIARRITAIYRDRFDVRLETSVMEVEAGDGPTGDDFIVRLSGVDGQSAVTGDMVLVATGRTPNGRTLGVESTGVELDPAGYVVVDEHQQTSAPGIWALGDICAPAQLKHKANEDARIVAHNLVHPDEPIASSLGPIPHAVFGLPQIASVGLTEPEAAAAGIDHVCVVHPYAAAAYGWALEDQDGFVKLVVDTGSRLVLGAHVIGAQAPTMIQCLVQGMQFGQTVDELGRGQWWIHPALSEVVEQALLAVEDSPPQ